MGLYLDLKTDTLNDDLKSSLHVLSNASEGFVVETANPRGTLDNEALHAILFIFKARRATYILSIHST